MKSYIGLYLFYIGEGKGEERREERGWKGGEWRERED